jgi:hypothetical protein
MLLDTDPDILHTIGWKASQSLLEQLSGLAPRPSRVG